MTIRQRARTFEIPISMNKKGSTTTQLLSNSIVDHGGTKDDNSTINNMEHNEFLWQGDEADDTSTAELHRRYRNRSLLLERTLQQKLHALHLSDQKLLVLQDAAKRVVARQHPPKQTTTATQAAATHVHVVNNDANVAKQSPEIHEWQKQQQLLERSESERREAVRQLAVARQHYVDTMAHHEMQWANAQRQLVRESQRASANILHQQQAQHARQQKEWESQVVSLTERLAVSETKYEKLKRDNQRLVEEATVATTNATAQAAAAQTVRDEYEERMEIAQAAVAAAVQRETMVQKRYNALRDNYETLRQEHHALEQQLLFVTRPITKNNNPSHQQSAPESDSGHRPESRKSSSGGRTISSESAGINANIQPQERQQETKDVFTDTASRSLEETPSPFNVSEQEMPGKVLNSSVTVAAKTTDSVSTQRIDTSIATNDSAVSRRNYEWRSWQWALYCLTNLRPGRFGEWLLKQQRRTWTALRHWLPRIPLRNGPTPKDE